MTVYRLAVGELLLYHGAAMFDTVLEPDYQIEIDPNIFNDIYMPLLHDNARVQILYGGGSSGKSVFKSQQVVVDLMAGGRNYLICRAVARTIRNSVFNEVRKRIVEFGVSELFIINKSDFVITCSNGYQAIFVGLDDVEKIKSITPEVGVITDIWVEEATETERNTIKSLMKRQRGGSEHISKRIHLTFNPILQDHWIFSEYFAPIAWTDKQTSHRSPNLSILKTWFEHNKFLTSQDRQDLLDETDKYYSDVYTWGNWGVLGNVIFTNWRVEDLSYMQDQFTYRYNGLDFGFAKNPAAIGCSHYDKTREIIYCFKEFYETDYTNDMLADICIDMFGKELVTCDSAEPKSIKELVKHGVRAVGATKGKDSVRFGIDWLKQRTIIVDKTCINWQNELRQYKWKEGADGKPINVNGKPVPVDANNHLIDGGLRYAYESIMNNRTARAV